MNMFVIMVITNKLVIKNKNKKNIYIFIIPIKNKYIYFLKNQQGEIRELYFNNNV